MKSQNRNYGVTKYRGTTPARRQRKNGDAHSMAKTAGGAMVGTVAVAGGATAGALAGGGVGAAVGSVLGPGGAAVGWAIGFVGGLLAGGTGGALATKEAVRWIERA